MWLSKQMKSEVPTADADLGMTTIAGENAGVVTRGEVRDLPVYGPGGYVWLPESGATVLVIKGGPGGEEQCVVGARQSEGPAGMQPGEIYLHGAGGGSVYLRADGSMEVQTGGTLEVRTEGTLELKGDTVSIEGLLLINGTRYKPCECTP